MKIEKDNFKRVLNIIKPGLAKKEILEQTTHFIFTGEELFTYNDKICVSHPFKTDFACSVIADDLIRILNGMKSKEIEVFYDTNQLRIEAKKERAGLFTFPEGQISTLVASLGIKDLLKRRWRFLPNDFSRGLSLCIFSASRDITHGILAGILVEGGLVTSTDDLRISRYSLDSKVHDSFIIPVSSAVELVGFSPKKYLLTDSWIHFQTSNQVVFSSRRLVGDYPDVSSFFNVEGEEVVFPDNLLNSIEAVTVMAEGEFDLDRRISVRVSSGSVSCRAERDKGWVEHEVESTYNGKTLIFEINPIFLRQILEKSTKMILSEEKSLFLSDKFQHVMAMPLR